jgi:hypothetical protein
MKKSLFLACTSLFFLACGSSVTDVENMKDTTTQVTNEEVVEIPEKKIESPRRQATGIVDGVTVSVDYGSPTAKERVIWGELVPYNEVWRAGANETTAITFDSDVLVNRSKVKAGTYALFIIPRENEPWTVILNEEWSKELHGVWGAYNYKPEKDVLQFDVTPTWSTEIDEALTYSVTNTGLTFIWEKASFDFTISKK